MLKHHLQTMAKNENYIGEKSTNKQELFGMKYEVCLNLLYPGVISPYRIKGWIYVGYAEMTFNYKEYVCLIAKLILYM